MPRILIVDENEDNRDVLARRLQRRGFDITVAIGGREAIKQASDYAPDLILMDINMPELVGWEATTQIRSNGISIPIIALTAHAMEGARDRASEAGCSDYHAKPVQLEKLTALIETHLADSAK